MMCVTRRLNSRFLKNSCLKLYSNETLSRSSSTAAESPAFECLEESLHIPVMVSEVLESLSIKPNDTIVDMTFGCGGHARRFIERGARVIAVDRDPFAHQIAEKLCQDYPGKVVPVLSKFSELPEILEEKGIHAGCVDGILFDLGCSSLQMDDPSRGFSISRDGPLDMRMDAKRNPKEPTAADVLAHLREDQIYKIIKVYGEERQARKIARTIVEGRYLFKNLRTTQELAELVASAIGNVVRYDKLGRPTHCATKTFQAVRIFVNNEINELNYGLEIAYKYLKVGGKISVLSFHSLEDRVVKRQLVGIDLDEPVSKTISQKYRNAVSWHSNHEVFNLLDKKWRPLNKHVITPSQKEIKYNPRARSAKLRAAVKLH